MVEIRRPDVVLVTPLVDLGSGQEEFVKAAHELGMHTGLCVCSWDNLTNKGLIRTSPELVTVWNEFQRDEAIELHAVPAKCIVVTGAHCYDHWFGWEPELSRDGLCEAVGLDPSREFVLYLCSSPFIAPSEVDFVKRWLSALRSAEAADLQDVGVLVRPHPQNANQWRDVDLSTFGNAVIWPRAGANPIDRESKSRYFDCIFHSAAVIGVNTSAQIEAGIVGRPVHTILDAEFAETQEGTLHFNLLLEASGGLLQVAGDFDEHLEQLRLSVANGGGSERSRTFVEGFVRPLGLDRPATPVLVETIEELADRPAPEHGAAPVWALFVRPLLYPIALVHGLVLASGKRRAKVEKRRGRRRAPDERAARESRAEKTGSAIRA